MWAQNRARINKKHMFFPKAVKHSEHRTPLGPTGAEAMTQSGQILTSKHGKVTVVELNRLKKRNALSQSLIDELIEVLSKLNQDPAVRAVVLTGSEQGPFCGTPHGEAANVSTLIACSWGGSCRASHHHHSRGLSTWVAERPK